MCVLDISDVRWTLYVNEEDLVDGEVVIKTWFTEKWLTEDCLMVLYHSLMVKWIQLN